MEDRIAQFLSTGCDFGVFDHCTGSGYGCGDGSGNGYGRGHGEGNDDSDSTGFGDRYSNGFNEDDPHYYEFGFGSFCGCGNIDGREWDNGSVMYGIHSLNGKKVYTINQYPNCECAFIIDDIYGDYAKCKLLNEDLTTTDCYIAKVGNCFALAITLGQAFEEARWEYLRSFPSDKTIQLFIEKYPNLEETVKNDILFKWYGVITRTPESHINELLKKHGIELYNGSMRISEFLDFTKDRYLVSFEPLTIKQLIDKYNN